MTVIMDEPLGAERVGADDEAAGTIGAEAGEGADDAVGRCLHRHEAGGRCARSGGRAAGQGERGRGGDEKEAGGRWYHLATLTDTNSMSICSDDWKRVCW